MGSKFVFLRETGEERVIIICPWCGKSRDWKQGDRPVNVTTDAVCEKCKSTEASETKAVRKAMSTCIDCGRMLPTSSRWLDDDGIRCAICNREHQRQMMIMAE